MECDGNAKIIGAAFRFARAISLAVEKDYSTDFYRNLQIAHYHQICCLRFSYGSEEFCICFCLLQQSSHCISNPIIPSMHFLRFKILRKGTQNSSLYLDNVLSNRGFFNVLFYAKCVVLIAPCAILERDLCSLHYKFIKYGS